MSSEEIETIARNFSVVDYIVLGSLLAISSGIGIYHACTGGKQSTTKEFLLADRNMNAFPVAMSLVASFISAITFLGTPAENYIHGCMYWLFGISYIFVGIVTIRVYMPVFFKMNITSAYEYLEIRFSRSVRISGMLTFTLMMVIYMGIVIYAPALALSAVSSLHLWGCVLSIGLVCTFYTTIGGMKAVLWTDVFQVTIMFIGFFAMIIGAAIRVGGFGKGWQIAKEGGRIDFWDFRPDPTIRHTFWSVVFGGTFTWLAVYGVNQSQVQRYLTCGTPENARKALILASIGMVLVVCAACLTGIMMYAFYADCDPLKAGMIKTSDQLVPFLVMELFGNIPGLPGLLVSSCFSAALSTVSSGLNSLAAVTAEDIVKPIWPNMEEKRYTLVTKMLAAAYGCVAIFMAFVASVVGDVLQESKKNPQIGTLLVSMAGRLGSECLLVGVQRLTSSVTFIGGDNWVDKKNTLRCISKEVDQFTALSIFGMVGGPLLGLFSLGMFFPWANSVGAIVGLITGLVCAFWINIGSQIYPPPLDDPLRTLEGCLERYGNYSDFTFDPSLFSTELPMTGATPEERPGIATLYALSYSWYSFAFAATTVIVGLLVSLCTGRGRASSVDPQTMCPLVDVTACCLPEKIKSHMRCGVNYEVKSEPELTNVNYTSVQKECGDEENIAEASA